MSGLSRSGTEMVWACHHLARPTCDVRSDQTVAPGLSHPLILRGDSKGWQGRNPLLLGLFFETNDKFLCLRRLGGRTALLISTTDKPEAPLSLAEGRSRSWDRAQAQRETLAPRPPQCRPSLLGLNPGPYNISSLSLPDGHLPAQAETPLEAPQAADDPE